MVKTIKIDDIEYIRKEDVEGMALEIDNMKCVMVRTYSAGVHFGYLKSKEGKEVTLIKSKRVWYWDGACSLSQLAMEGSTKPENCKISISVNEIILTEAIEIIPMTEKAKECLYNIKEWKK